MCVQCYLCAYNVIYVCAMLFYVYTVIVIYFQYNLNAYKSSKACKMVFKIKPLMPGGNKKVTHV